MNLKKMFVIFSLIISFKSFGETILFLGDSLTEGHEVKPRESYPSEIKRLFKKDGKDIDVINGGVSGSTTASGLSRLKWYMKKKPDLMVLALGANDGLRGLDVTHSKKNLIEIIDYARENEVEVFLAEMQMPPNYGKEYTEKFKRIYKDIHNEKKVPLIPFLLKDVAGKKKYNLPDGIHPNPKGYKIIAKHIYNYIKDKF